MKKYGISAPAKPKNTKRMPCVIEGQRKCTKCNIIKPISEYTLRQDRNEGDTIPVCKSCNTDISFDRYTKNKKMAVAYKGGKCELCEKTFPLECYAFHHLEPEHKDFNIRRS